MATENVLQLVGNLAAELRAGAVLRPRLDDHLEHDLGFDSLERAELLRRIENKFGVRLPTRMLATTQTPRDLVRAVSVEGGAAPAGGGDTPANDAMLTDAAGKAASIERGAAPFAPAAALARPRERRHGVGITVGDLLFGAYAWALLVSLGLGALAVVMLLPRLAWRRSIAHSIARSFVAASGIPVHVSGTESIPAQGPMTVVANHASYIDAIVLTRVLPARCTFVAKGELGRHIATRLLLGRIGARFVERVDAEASVMAAQEIATRAKRNESFVFFAEGTFTRAPGLRAFRMGAFVTAASAGTPVVAVAIRGTRRLLPEGRWAPHRGPLQITVSAPILPDGSDWAAAVRLRDRTRAAILAGCGEPDLANLGPKQEACTLQESGTAAIRSPRQGG